MAEECSSRRLFMWALLAAMLSQTLVTPAMCRRNLEGFAEKKNYYPPGSHSRHGGSHRNPSCPTPSTPSHGGSGSYTPTPSHGGGGYSPPTTPGIEPGTPTTPSHGGGGYYSPPGGVSPPTTPGIEPGTPTTPSHGGGGYYSPPGGLSPPTTPGIDPGTPTTPSHGGGGYYSPPGGISPPTTPGIDPGTPTPPSHGGGGYYSPPTPAVEPTPTTPLVPPTPYTPTVPTPPSPLFPIDPNVPPFFTGTCNYWRTHPQVIWGLFGYWGTLGGLLGGAGTPAGNLNVLDALRNTRTDGIGALYREATASFLNSMVNRRFVFNTQQVRDAFVTALASEQTAAHQAQIFQRANEGRPRH